MNGGVINEASANTIADERRPDEEIVAAIDEKRLELNALMHEARRAGLRCKVVVSEKYVYSHPVVFVDVVRPIRARRS